MISNRREAAWRYRLTDVCTTLSSRVTLEPQYIRATPPATFTPSIAIMSVVWEKPGRVHPVLCTQQSTRVPILMLCVIRPKIYTCTVVERLMPACKQHLVLKNWARKRLLHSLHAESCL